MPKVKVWNDNKHPHTEVFKGDKIYIGPGEAIEMEWEEAIEFKGQFTGMKIRADGTHDPAGFKMIRVERPAEPIFKDPPLVNHANGQVALTRDELEESLARFAHMRAPVDRDAEPKSPGVADLLARIAALEAAQEEKRGKPKAPSGRKEA